MEPYIISRLPTAPKELSFVDVGGGIGAGTEYLRAAISWHYARQYFDVKVSATVIERELRDREWCQHFYPKLRFLARDINELTEKFDFAICSHVIEHLENPVPFVEKLRSLADAVFVYAPYNEQLGTDTPTHMTSVDDSLLSALSPDETFMIASEGWKKTDCVLMIFNAS